MDAKEQGDQVITNPFKFARLVHPKNRLFTVSFGWGWEGSNGNVKVCIVDRSRENAKSVLNAEGGWEDMEGDGFSHTESSSETARDMWELLIKSGFEVEVGVANLRNIKWQDCIRNMEPIGHHAHSA